MTSEAHDEAPTHPFEAQGDKEEALGGREHEEVPAVDASEAHDEVQEPQDLLPPSPFGQPGVAASHAGGWGLCAGL